nr:GNAT family N-acetyltransferase [uncultured Marinifilum sp.]
MIEYKINTSKSENILIHLNKCNNHFNPPLNQTVNLKEYSDKIHKNSITFEAWYKKELIGLVATYFNDNKIDSFITNVSVIKEFWGHGIASNLIDSCISYARNNSFKQIQLEVNKDSKQAIHVYEKYGFKNKSQNNESIIMKNTLHIKK